MALSSKLRLPASSGPPTEAARQVFWVLRVDFGLFLAALALTRLAVAFHAQQPCRPLSTGHRA